MIEVVRRLKEHFDGLDDRYTCFANLGFQSEGWFKGELLTVLSRLWMDGAVQNLDREITVEGKRVDLMIQMDGVRHWIELKHWLIGRQKGFIYNPPFYFADRSSVGIVPDVDKLNRPSLSPADRRWLLLLLTANPSIAPWAAGVARFNDKFAPRRLASRTRPDEYPPTYFLGLLELMDGAGGLESGSGSWGVDHG